MNGLQDHACRLEIVQRVRSPNRKRRQGCCREFRTANELLMTATATALENSAQRFHPVVLVAATQPSVK